MEKHVVVPDRVFTIEHFFSADECERFIEISEQIGFDNAPVTTTSGPQMRPDIRNNSRVLLDNSEMADALWERIAPLVPSPLWKRTAIGLNERLRFYRYDPGQTFKPHYDGSFKRDNGEKSQVTFMVYLNDNFAGGETKFDLPYPFHEVDVKPKAGMALLFWHSLRHEGAPVRSGRKYVLRSDVMYSALPAGESED